MSRQLLIVGASGRAAAESARRAGFIPWVVDAFGDDDTRRVAECRVARRYPSGLVAEARRLPPGDWMFVGGLENSPSIVERLATERRLLGVDGPSLRRVRDPWSVRDSLTGVDVRFPDIREDSADLPRDRTWLWKSRRSAGGLGVGFFDQNTPSQIDRGRYFERRVSGRSCGATFLGDGRDAWFIGAVELGTDAGDPARPFLFGGAIGPIELADGARARFEALGRRLASEFGLSGLFGVDVILDGDAIWVLEVNPRYTASMELLEHAYGRPLIADHVRACRDRALPERANLTARLSVGKRIVYAGATGGTVAPRFTDMLWKLRGEGPVPAVADIPPAGSTVRPYSPLVTLVASDADWVVVADVLRERSAEISGQFRQTCGAV